MLSARRLSGPRLAAAALAGLLPSACAQPGDFGRPAPSAWNALVETTGTLAAAERGEAALLPLTDDEQVLRDRAWRFLMPAIPGDVFRDALANLTRTRVLPPGSEPAPVASYWDGLSDAAARSQAPLYRRLSEDAVADARLLPPFTEMAGRVLAADARRLRSLPLAPSLGPEAVREAALRVAENRCLIAWVRLETGARVERYRYALEHLFAALPSGQGVEAERAVAALEARRALLAPLLPPDAAPRCGLVPGAPAAPEPAILSARY